MLSLGNAFEMQFDCFCTNVAVDHFISVYDDFRELDELPDSICLEYNSPIMFWAECSLLIMDRKSSGIS